jgi:hypothetical protein
LKALRQHLDAVNDLLISSGLESFYPSIFELKLLENLETLYLAIFAV